MKYRFILFTILLLIPLKSVSAKEEVNVSCEIHDKNYVCQFVADFDYAISAIDFHYEIPKNVDIISTSVDDAWEGSMDNQWFSLYSERDHIGSIPLGTLTLKSKKKIDNQDIRIYDLKSYDAFFQEHIIETSVNIPKNEHNIIKFIIPCVIILIGIVIVFFIKKGRSSQK